MITNEFAPRQARDLLGDSSYESIIYSIDWNRILIEARGHHCARPWRSTKHERTG